MKLPGIVTNITNFGAFVDIGVHQDGLVHLSQMSDRFISNPNEVVKVQQRVEVTVTEIDTARNRIGLSMKGNGPAKKTDKSQDRKENFKNTNKNERRKPEPETDMQSKLAALMGKFK